MLDIDLLGVRVVGEELLEESPVALRAAALLVSVSCARARARAGGERADERGGARAHRRRVREAEHTPAHAHAARLVVRGRREQPQLLARAEAQPEPRAPREQVHAECVESAASATIVSIE